MQTLVESLAFCIHMKEANSFFKKIIRSITFLPDVVVLILNGSIL